MLDERDVNVAKEPWKFAFKGVHLFREGGLLFPFMHG